MPRSNKRNHQPAEQPNQSEGKEQKQEQPTRYDSIWKALPLPVLVALIRTIKPGVSEFLEPWKTSLKQFIDREVDGVFLTTIKGIKTLVLLEYQNYVDPDMPWRIYEYVFLLQRQYRLQFKTDIPVLPIVTWAVTGNLPTPRYENWVDGKCYGIQEYEQIILPELDWQGVDPLLLVLAPFLHGVTVDDLPQIAQTLYQAAPDRLKKQLVAALLMMSERAYPDIATLKTSILTQMRTTMDEIWEALKTSTWGVALLDEGRQEGVAQGRQEGVAQGRQEGIAEGEVKGLIEERRHTIMRLWRARFGKEMAAKEREHIVQLDQDQYDGVLDALLDPAITMAQVRAKFRRTRPTTTT